MLINVDYSYIAKEGMIQFKYKVGYIDKKGGFTVVDEIRDIWTKDKITFYMLLDKWNNPSQSSTTVYKYWSTT